MDHVNEKNNRVYLNGEIVTPAIYSHEVYGEGFYEFNVSVNRLSGQADVLPVTVSERLVEEGRLDVGARLIALGQFRSYNKIVEGKSKLMLTVFVRELLSAPLSISPNSVVLSGYVCKPPVYKVFKLQRLILNCFYKEGWSSAFKPV